MEVSLLNPLAAVVTGVDLADAAASVEDLRVLLAEHGVLIMRDQVIGDQAFVEFLGLFGELMFTAGETAVDGFPDLNVVSNVGRDRPPRSTFHVDTSYVRRPPAYTALRAVTVPAVGGQTLFSNQYRAYETLPHQLRVTLADRTIRHVVTGLDLGPEEETAAEHPVFSRHPISGRMSVYLTSPARCAGISGMAAEEAARTVRVLFEHSTREQNVLRHSWSAGDVVMWDNRCVLHRADHDGVVGDRVMHRGMVAGV